MQSITSPIIIICLHKIVKYFQEFIKLYSVERVVGIEPTPLGRKHNILPLNYTRISIPIIV